MKTPLNSNPDRTEIQGLAPSARLERAASRLGGERSIQLSYEGTETIIRTSGAFFKRYLRIVMASALCMRRRERIASYDTTPIRNCQDSLKQCRCQVIVGLFRIRRETPYLQHRKAIFSADLGHILNAGARFASEIKKSYNYFTPTLATSVSSYCRTFGSERAESIEKRSNFAGAGRKRDGLSRVGQAERKRNGFSFFGLWRFFKGRGIGGGFSFQDELSGGEDGDKVLECLFAPCHRTGRKAGGKDVADMRFGRAAVEGFGTGVTDMDGVKMVGQIAQRLLRLLAFRVRFENLRSLSPSRKAEDNSSLYFLADFSSMSVTLCRRYLFL